MDIRKAILQAADQIERHPSSYDFGRSSVPECGSTGCALGWIGHYMGLKAKVYNAPLFNGLSASKGTRDFYEEMTRLEGEARGWCYGHWPRDAQVCARTLRAYADKHYPAPDDAEVLMSRLARLPFHEDEEDEFEEEEVPV